MAPEIDSIATDELRPVVPERAVTFASRQWPSPSEGAAVIVCEERNGVWSSAAASKRHLSRGQAAFDAAINLRKALFG